MGTTASYHMRVQDSGLWRQCLSSHGTPIVGNESKRPYLFVEIVAAGWPQPLRDQEPSIAGKMPRRAYSMERARSDDETPVLKKILYLDGDACRVLRGFVSESGDGLFFVIARPLGDVILIAKSAVRTITPVRDAGART